MKTRYIIALAAGAFALVGCQREELAEPGVLSGKEGIVKFAPSVGGILSAVKSGYTADAPAATGTQSSLTLMSEDGGFTLPMDLSVTSLEIGDGTKATLINENGGISGADFATAIGNTFWVAAWDKPVSGDPAQIIPDKTISGYTTTDGKYQKVMYRTKDVTGASLATPYWMTMQPMGELNEGVTAIGPADDEYIWKKIVPENGHAETKTFYAYTNVPTTGVTMALLAAAGGQTMTLSAIPDKDVLMGYYQGEGKTGPEDAAKHTGTASIQFHHPFAAVKVKKGTVADGVTITGVAIEKVYGKGGEGDDGKLMVKQEENTFTWTRADGDPFEDENLVESISVTCDGEAALVLPQTFPSKARIRVTLEQGGKTFNVYYTLSGSWAPGTLYTYTIGYDPLPDELLPGKFSVSATKYVQFSRGNLYCTRSGEEGSYTYEFGLERNQYDFRTRPGYASVINGVYAVNGTGANMSGHFYWDIAKAQAGKDYGAFSTTPPTGGTTSDILDWGPALDAASHWTTLSREEWNYLISTRKVKSASGLHNTCEFVYFKGVDGLDKGVDGLIIYPDDYDGEMFTGHQEITAIPDGCVFIPMAGKFFDGAVDNVNKRCNYWTSSHGDGNAYQFLAYFNTTCHANNALSRANGMSVRLVQRFVKSVQIGNLYWATENLAITASGKREFNHTGHIIGDYFQWAAHAGYCGNATDADKGLLVYNSFKSTMCGDGSNAFTFKSGKQFKKENTPYYSGSAFTKYTDAEHATLDRTGAYTGNNDDVVNIILGDGWRMPTSAEFVAMREATYWAWDATDKGYYVFKPGEGTAGSANARGTITDTDDKSKALLFFPAAGYGCDNYPTIVGEYGLYWSSSLKSDGSIAAYDLYFHSTNITQDGGGRYSGLPVRPVHD